MSAGRGFTIIELLVVIGVLAALAGVAIPILTTVRRNAAISATATVVQAVATTIANNQVKAWTVTTPAGERSWRMWDINGDGLIDGDPALEDPLLPGSRHYPAAVLTSPYRGLVAMTKPVLPKRFYDQQTGRVVDPWGQPLRIAYATRVYGSLGYGVWSAGPDAIDDPPDQNHDDIRSWDIAPE